MLRDRTVDGLVAMLIGHASQVVLFFVLEMVSQGGTARPDGMIMVVTFGLIQLIYAVPLFGFAAVKHRAKFAKSVALVALVTGVLNIAVVVYLFSGPPIYAP